MKEVNEIVANELTRAPERGHFAAATYLLAAFSRPSAKSS